MPSLVEALELKYGDVFSHIDSSTDSDKFLILEDEQKSIINGYCNDDETIQVEIFVPKISPREKIPSLLILNDCDIATAGEKQDLNDKCRVVEELDLAKNKLNHWCEVFTILKQMPRLRFLNLSFNKLSTPLDYPLNGSSFQSQHLQILILNSTMVDWKSIRKLLKWFPNLVELHLSKNDYKSVKVNDETTARCVCNNQQCANCQKHLSLQVLYFNGNLIHEWAEIIKFGIKFPNLQTLVLANCPIESLSGTDSISNERSQLTKPNNYENKIFANLKVLNLNSTLLSSWNDIEALGRFPVLQNVRVQNWPLWELQDHTEHERRQLLIARLPKVTTLNGSGPISDQEREDSERAFIRYYMEKNESDRPARYFELVNVHGKLDPLVSVDLRPEKRVRVTFTCNSNREVRLVDVYRTVSDLKTKLETFSGIPASQMRLFYVDQDLIDIQGPEEMKYPNKQLYSYNICSGDEIIIDLKLKK